MRQKSARQQLLRSAETLLEHRWIEQIESEGSDTLSCRAFRRDEKESRIELSSADTFFQKLNKEETEVASKNDKSREILSASTSDSAHDLVAALISQGSIRMSPEFEDKSGFPLPRISFKTEPNPLKGLVQRFEILTGGNGVHRFWIGPNPDNTQECIIGADDPSANLSVSVLVSAHFNQREVSLTIAYLYINDERVRTAAASIRKVSVQ